MSKFKNVTHFVAGGIAAAAAFAVSPAGQAVITQYPKLSAAAGLLAMLATLYHQPVKGS